MINPQYTTGTIKEMRREVILYWYSIEFLHE